MKKLRCVFYGIPIEQQPYMKKKLKGYTVLFQDAPISTDTLDPKTEVLGVFVDSPVTSDIIDRLQKLQLILAMSTGYDHIHIATAREKHIPVCTVPSYGENTVAEHALALILALSRQLFPSIKRVKEGVYDYHGLQGWDIKGKTIGVVGTGKIGMHLIRMLQGFDATVIAYDPYPKKELQETYGFSYATFDRLLRTADVVSLHVPLTKDTRHMLRTTTFKKMKPGAYLINTARGGLVDAEALVHALNNGTLGGAGLDVLEEEQLIDEYDQLVTLTDPRRVRLSMMNAILIDHPKTIVTPHNAFNSAEAVHRIMDTTIENLTQYVQGHIQNNVAV